MTAAIATREKVFDACNKLFAEGQPVTQARVAKILGGGSYSTISHRIKDWKEQSLDDIPIKDYPMSESIKKQYDRMNQEHWNVFLRFYEPTTESEIIADLEKEVESLKAQLEVAKQNSIRLEESEKVRKEQNERHEKLVDNKG